MPEQTCPEVARDNTVVVSDLGGANTYTVDNWDGSFTSSGGQYATTDINNNGEHGCPRRGAPQIMNLGWSVYSRGLGSAAFATMPDICRWQDSPGAGTFVDTTWTSTLSGQSDVLAADVARIINGAPLGIADKTELYTDVRLRTGYTAGDPSTWGVEGTTAILAPTYS